jgi:hypothetical protein
MVVIETIRYLTAWQRIKKGCELVGTMVTICNFLFNIIGLYEIILKKQ